MKKSILFFISILSLTLLSGCFTYQRSTTQTSTTFLTESPLDYNKIQSEIYSKVYSEIKRDTSSKCSVLVMGVIAIPLIVELPVVLKLWLTNVPDYAMKFTQWILLSSLMYQVSAGLMAGVLAVGKMKVYQIVISIIMLLNLPIAYMLLKFGYEPYWVLIGMFGCEILSLIAHLIFSKNLFNLSISRFCLQVL